MTNLRWAAMGLILLGVYVGQVFGCSGSLVATGGGGGACCACTLSDPQTGCSNSKTFKPGASVDCDSFCLGASQSLQRCSHAAGVAPTISGTVVDCPAQLVPDDEPAIPAVATPINSSGSSTGAGGSTGTSGSNGLGGATGTSGSNAFGGAAGTSGSSGFGGAMGTSGSNGLGGDLSTTTGAGGSATTDAGGDPSCTTALAKTAAPCTIDCQIACGFNGIGTKTCTCMGGFYSACPCPRPASYLGGLAAPYCNTPDQMTTGLKGTPCTKEWDECIGKDPNTGTPLGCACMLNPTNGTLLWACGTTNKWFSLAL
jgi:hypothetical protein